MREQHWCGCCGLNKDHCRCAPAQLERHHKLQRLESLKQEIATLSRELGLSAGESGNRHERRAARARGGR